MEKREEAKTLIFIDWCILDNSYMEKEHGIWPIKISTKYKMVNYLFKFNGEDIVIKKSKGKKYTV